jgi:hypothetical protein
VPQKHAQYLFQFILKLLFRLFLIQFN